MTNKAKTVDDLRVLLGEEKVLNDPQVLQNADGHLTRNYQRAFGYQPEYLPICVVKAFCTDDVAKTMKYCNENAISVIVKTGCTCSEDQLVLMNDHSIYLDASPMNELKCLDEENMMVTVGCGMPLARLEEIVNQKGYTTGHCPQSQPLACMGGLVATRSIGQFSTYYGGIEDLVCGLEAVMPDGRVVRIRNVPRRAAGPDLRHLFIGSEGAWAVITEITVKLFTYYPDDMWKGGYVVESYDVGLDIIREVIVKGYRPSVVRLYDKPDMDYNYNSVTLQDGQAFLFFIAEGPAGITKATGEAIHAIAQTQGGRYVGTKAVDHWLVHRNSFCDRLGTEAEHEKFRQTKVAYATVEISASWSDIKKVYHDVMENVPQKIEYLTLFGAHVSHSYQIGTNIYFIFEFKSPDPTQTHNDLWQIYKAICDEVIKHPTGGIAHHHGIGKIRVKMIQEELGSSYPLLKGIKEQFDPNGIMNPGNLVPLD